MAAIAVTGPDGSRRTLRLEGRRLTVGRAPDCDLRFPSDLKLSRRHLAFERQEDHWRVRDLGSRNGTWLNGALLEETRRLREGDRLVAGDAVLVYAEAAGSDPRGRVLWAEPGADLDATTASTRLATVLEGEEPSARSAGLDHPAVGVLVRAGRELAGHRPLAQLFDVILALAVEAVGAERGVLMTLEGGNLVVRALRGEGFRISSSVRDRVLEARESILVRDTSLDEALRERRSIDLRRTRTMMAVPLQTDRDVSGLIYVESGGSAEPFSRNDLDLLTVLANVAAIRIAHQRHLEAEEERRLIERDLERAAEIQKGLLPEHPPAIEGLEVAGRTVPCRTVGGDYFGFFPGEEPQSLGLALGDVSGKGIAAALLMTGLQARVEVLAGEGPAPSEMMVRLNRSLAANSPSNCFVSFFFCVLDPRRGRIVWCNAGHNPPLLLRAGGEVRALDSGAGPVLGVLPDAGYEEDSLEFEPGDLLVLYSDGVTEERNPDEAEFGEERLREVLSRERGAPARDVVASVLRAVEDWAGGDPASDDVTVVAARRLPPHRHQKETRASFSSP